MYYLGKYYRLKHVINIFMLLEVYKIGDIIRKSIFRIVECFAKVCVKIPGENEM